MSEKRDLLKAVLKKYSVDAPIADVAEIRNYYKIENGAQISKHTVIDTLESLKLLEQCDYDELIDSQGYKKKTNIVFKRDIEPAEAKMMADQIASLSYITVKDRKDLVLRLRDVAGVGDKRGFDEFTGANVLEDNLSTQFMDTLTKLYTVTYKNHQLIEFTVNKNQYEWQEKEKPRKYEVVHPLSMAFHEGFYYLYCHLGDSDNVYSFRVDLIKNVKVVGEKDSRDMRVTEEELSATRRSPFVGKAERVVVQFDPAYTTYVLDRFGYNTAIKKSKQTGRSEIEVKAVTYGLEYWALRFLEGVEIIEPQSVRDRIKQMIEQSPYTK